MARALNQKQSPSKPSPNHSRGQLSEEEMSDLLGKIAAIGKSQAVIEFQLDGTILTANDKFLRSLGYTLEEVQGRHHGMFVDESYRHSYEYKEFWAKLGCGEYQSDEFRRIGK